MNALKILSPGGYTTVQDMGRRGFQHMGIPVSGVLDKRSAAMANLLVGNTPEAALLELTVMGAGFEVLKEMDIALTGAHMEIKINGRTAGRWQSLRVRPGDTVSIGQVQSGCRSYLSFSGGIDVPRIMGSRSTYAGGNIGGFSGRPLQKDDVLDTFDVPLSNTCRKIPESYIPRYPAKAVIRAIPGPQDDYFDEGLTRFFKGTYMVTPKADRMGYRLMGEKIHIRDDMPGSIISEPSMPGSIQIPADEQPIILLVEQTVGGYAKIATVISEDISRVVQTTPGDEIEFEKIPLETAHAISRQSLKDMERLKLISRKSGAGGIRIR